MGAEPFSSGAGAAEMERVVVVHSDDGARLQTLARLRAEVQVNISSGLRVEGLGFRVQGAGCRV